LNEDCGTDDVEFAHRNRIERTEDKLDELKVALENRIKAVIV
jgi:hypothetical protein